MSAYRRKSKLFAKLNPSSMRLRANTPEEGFRFKRQIPPIDEKSDWAVRWVVNHYPQLDAERQTKRAYEIVAPLLPTDIDISSPAPSMQKAVNTWHAIRNWVVYYRHHPEEARGQ
jgi:hypothetical protein